MGDLDTKPRARWWLAPYEPVKVVQPEMPKLRAFEAPPSDCIYIAPVEERETIGSYDPPNVPRVRWPKTTYIDKPFRSGALTVHAEINQPKFNPDWRTNKRLTERAFESALGLRT